MARKSYAAAQLEKQVLAYRPDATVEHGGPDGLGVYRTITFDEVTSAWLAEQWGARLDQRFASSVYDGGVLTLTLQSRSTLADDKSPFTLVPPPVERPEEIVISDSSGAEPVPPREELERPNPAKKTTPRKRAPAKKTTPRKRAAKKAT